MAAPQDNSPDFVRTAKILAQVGEELAFVEAGRDTGLLPINSLLMDFEELPRDGAPTILATGLTAARDLLDQILDGPGIFTGESIQFLNGWHSWMSSVTAGGSPRAANGCPSAGALSVTAAMFALQPSTSPASDRKSRAPCGWIEPGIWIGSSAQFCKSTRRGAAIGTGVLDSTHSSLYGQYRVGTTKSASYRFR